MLCRLIVRVEGGGGGAYRSSAADRLARRGVLIICIVVINLQELKPPPIGYHSMLGEAQKVREPSLHVWESLVRTYSYQKCVIGVWPQKYASTHHRSLLEMSARGFFLGIEWSICSIWILQG